MAPTRAMPLPPPPSLQYEIHSLNGRAHRTRPESACPHPGPLTESPQLVPVSSCLSSRTPATRMRRSASQLEAGENAGICLVEEFGDLIALLAVGTVVQ